MALPSRIVRTWNAISSTNTVVGIVGWPLWKALGGIVGGAAAVVVGFVSSVPPWGWFLLIFGGIGFGLLITNEIASKRLLKRLAQIQSDERTATSSQGGQGGFATQGGLAAGGGGGGVGGGDGGHGGNIEIRAGDGTEEVGTLAELVADDDIQRIYAFASDERQHLKEVWHWYEAQKANPQQYIKISVEHVDCSFVFTELPYIVVMFQVRNYHTVPLRIIRMEWHSGEVANLPLPPLSLGDRRPDVQRGSETKFGLRLYGIQGTNIPDALRRWAGSPTGSPTKVAWEFHGTWTGEIYDTEHTIETEPLSWTGIPNVNIPTTII